MTVHPGRRGSLRRRRAPRVVAYNALHVRPGVYDGAATFSLNTLQRLPEALPDWHVVGYVPEGEGRVAPQANLELRTVGEGAVHAGGRVALETLWLSVDLRRIRASALVSPHESIPLKPPCPVVVVAQNLVYHRGADDESFLGGERRERLHTRIRSVYYRRRMAEAYAKAAAVVAVSEHTAEVLERSAGLDRSKAVVVHEGSDSTFLGEPELPGAREPRLLAVSALSPYKNLEATIYLLAELRRRRPELVLDLAGGDWRGFRAVLERHAERRGVAEAVNFLGGVDPHGLARLYARSLLLVHLSDCESFGLPVVEAMRFGLPAVVARRSSLPEVAGGAALLVDPDDLAGMTAAVEGLLAAGMDELVERGRRRAGELTWEASAAGLAAVVESVVRART